VTILVARGEEEAIAVESLLRIRFRPKIIAKRAEAWLPDMGSWTPLEHQRPPAGWLIGETPDWLLRMGRGTGKTRTGAEMTLAHLREHGGAHCRVLIGAPTIADVRDVCAEGESGLMTIARHEFTVYNRSMLEATHYNGGRIKMLGSEEPGRWNGPQACFEWRDELALWNKDSYEMSEFGLRLSWADKQGQTRHAQSINTTTPKNRRWVRDFEQQPTTVTTIARMEDNPYLSEVAKRKLESRYGGTRLGRQELGGEYVDDVEGALWTRDMIEQARVTAAPALVRVVVAIDPAATHGEDSDFTGIAYGGLGVDGDCYVFGIEGVKLSPLGWARHAVNYYDEYQADRIVAERNNGGDMVESTIRQVRPNLPVKKLWASRGKTVRAEPVVALYENCRVHHVGIFADAEDEMCTFPVENENDDKVDALVWLVTELMIELEETVATESAAHRVSISPV
jgi:phage terminase large subunit-like protein